MDPVKGRSFHIPNSFKNVFYIAVVETFTSNENDNDSTVVNLKAHPWYKCVNTYHDPDQNKDDHNEAL